MNDPASLSVVDRMFVEPFAFDFFQALRLLERVSPERRKHPLQRLRLRVLAQGFQGGGDIVAADGGVGVVLAQHLAPDRQRLLVQR